jgi:hypothetical protein
MTHTFRLTEIPEFFDIARVSPELAKPLANLTEAIGLVPSLAFRLDLFETCVVAVEQVRKVAMMTFFLDSKESLMERGLNLYTDYEMSLDLFFNQLRDTRAVSESLRSLLCGIKERARRVAENKSWNVAIHVFPSSAQAEKVLRDNFDIRGHSVVRLMLRAVRKHMDNDPYLLHLKAALS